MNKDPQQIIRIAKNTNDRLFVPLNTKPFKWFRSREKDTELRGYGDRFNTETVYPGRAVQLVKGYNPKYGELWGVIEHVQTFPPDKYRDGTVALPNDFDYQRINPTVTSEKEFQQSVDEMLGQYNSYIAFQIHIPETETDP